MSTVPQQSGFILEDDELQTRLMEARFRSQLGVDALSADNVADAIDRIREYEGELIACFLDMRTPLSPDDEETDHTAGLQVREHLITEEKVDPKRIVLVTATFSPSDEAALQAKPYSAQDEIIVIEKKFLANKTLREILDES